MKIEYHNLYVHVVLTCFKRQSLIPSNHRVRIEKFITGVIKNLESHLYAIYANPDHLHILISISPTLSINNLVSTIAYSSESFINDNKLCLDKFGCQNSCSAFSVSKSDVDKVCKYILNQKERHKKKSFSEEYDEFIRHYQKTIYIENKVIRFCSFCNTLG